MKELKSLVHSTIAASGFHFAKRSAATLGKLLVCLRKDWRGPSGAPLVGARFGLATVDSRNPKCAAGAPACLIEPGLAHFITAHNFSGGPQAIRLRSFRVGSFRTRRTSHDAPMVAALVDA